MDPDTMVGPLASKKQRDDLAKQVEETIGGGATVLYGSLDYKPLEADLQEGNFF